MTSNQIHRVHNASATGGFLLKTIKDLNYVFVCFVNTSTFCQTEVQPLLIGSGTRKFKGSNS